MYQPNHFRQTDIGAMHGLVHAHPFATLVTRSGDSVTADHLPFEIDPEPAPFGTLRGHVARANPLWHTHPTGAEALVIFQGPDAYISPSWYPTKREHGRAVPTWNYAVVHAHGPLQFIEDRTWLRALVGRLTTRHEAGRPEPWQITDAPPDYIDKMLAAIVGLELPIVRLEGKWKASQNQPAANRSAVASVLRQSADARAAALADLVDPGDG
jgi:transcriptional regulator